MNQKLLVRLMKDRIAEGQTLEQLKSIPIFKNDFEEIYSLASEKVQDIEPKQVIKTPKENKKAKILKEKRVAVRLEDTLLDDLDLYIKITKDLPSKRDRSKILRSLLVDFLKINLPKLGYIYGSGGNMTEEHLDMLKKNLPLHLER